MSEKVLFEYRASEEGSIRIGTLYGCCSPCDAEPPGSRSSLQSSLAFFERIYGDLYGKSEAPDPEGEGRAWS